MNPYLIFAFGCLVGGLSGILLMGLLIFSVCHLSGIPGLLQGYPPSEEE